MIITYQWRTFETFYALQSLGNYWVENERWITAYALESEEAGRPKWVPETEDEEGEYRHEMDMARQLHDHVLFPTFRYSCVIMLYSVIEHELKRFVNSMEKDRGKPKLSIDDINASSFLHRIAKFAEVFFHCDITQVPEYGSLHDLRKIRNCIVHSRGEVDASRRDGKYLVEQTGRIPGFFAYEGTEMMVEEACPEYFLGRTWLFFQHLFQKVNWKIDESWELKGQKPFPKNLHGGGN